MRYHPLINNSRPPRLMADCAWSNLDREFQNVKGPQSRLKQQPHRGHGMWNVGMRGKSRPQACWIRLRGTPKLWQPWETRHLGDLLRNKGRPPIGRCCLWCGLQGIRKNDTRLLTQEEHMCGFDHFHLKGSLDLRFAGWARGAIEFLWGAVPARIIWRTHPTQGCAGWLASFLPNSNFLFCFCRSTPNQPITYLFGISQMQNYIIVQGFVTGKYLHALLVFLELRLHGWEEHACV